MSKGPAALHNENKKYGLHEPPKIRGQHRKVIKLISRGLGNLINEVLLEETADEFEKEIRERTNSHTRKNHSRISVADEEAVAKAIDNSASAVLGIAKIDDGVVPEISTNPFMNYFKIPMDNNNTIDKLLSELINIKMNQNNSQNSNDANASKTFILDNKWNNTKSICLKLSSGKSKQALCRLNSQIKEVINYEAKNNDEIEFRVRQTVNTLESNHKTSMSEMLHDIGYTDDTKEKVIPGNVFAAMVDEGQFKLEQQRVLNKYYFYVHGKRITEPESKRTLVSQNFL